MRIKLQLPGIFKFHTSIPVRITDLNYGGHVGNDTVLSIIHEARMQFLKSIGYTELNVEGVGLIMRDAALEFKAELFYRDIINCHVKAENFSPVSFDLFYKLVNEQTGIIVAVAKTGMVSYDYDRKKVTALPSEALEKLRVG